MYFPFLRGKQFELLALREISDHLLPKKGELSPIIEPVKELPTFKSALLALSKRGINFNLIVNPSVGDLSRKRRKEPVLEYFASVLKDCENYQLAILIDPRSINWLEEILSDESPLNSLRPEGVTLIHNEVNDRIHELIAFVTDRWPVRYNVVNFATTNRRYYREFSASSVVSLDDGFVCLERNADYLDQDESSFSDEHLYYAGEGFAGFSDFLTIGDNFQEGGFAPYAVAIHLSYADDGRKIRVKHFVSENNEDTTDVAGKFAVANRKLVAWCNARGLDSVAIAEFRRLDSSGHFPGLGTVKKLSIMHHIELVLSLI